MFVLRHVSIPNVTDQPAKPKKKKRKGMTAAPCYAR